MNDQTTQKRRGRPRKEKTQPQLPDADQTLTLTLSGPVNNVMETREGPRGFFWAAGQRHGLPMPEGVKVGDVVTVNVSVSPGHE